MRMCPPFHSVTSQLIKVSGLGEHCPWFPTFSLEISAQGQPLSIIVHLNKRCIYQLVSEYSFFSNLKIYLF